MEEILLIDYQHLEQYSPLPKNLDQAKVMPHVFIAQETYIRPIYGDALYEDIIDKIANDGLTDTDKALLIKTYPYLATMVAKLSIRALAYNFSEKSVVKEASDGSQTISRDELRDYELSLLQDAERCKNMLEDYLCRCREAYPLYDGRACGCNKTNDVDDLIYFPSKKRKNCSCGKGKN